MLQAQARVLFPCALLLASLWGCPGNNTCQEGFASQNGQCVKRCNSPTECAAFETCNDGLCVTAGGGSSGAVGSSSAAGNTSTANSSSVTRSSSAAGSGSLGSSNATSTAATSGTATSTLSGSSSGAGSSGGTSVGGSSVGGSSVGGSSGPLPSSSAAVSTQSSSVASSSLGPNSSSVMGASSSAGASSASSSSSGAPAPALTAVSPNKLLAGCGGTLFTLQGANFATGDVAQLNGQDMATAVVNAATLEVSVPASYLLTPGTYTFRVRRGGVFTTDAVFTLRPTPASHDFFLHGGYTLLTWSTRVFLFNPGNQLASVQVDFLEPGSATVTSNTMVPPSRVVVVDAPDNLDAHFIHVVSPDVAVAGAVLTANDMGGSGAVHLAGPQVAAQAATVWATPHVTGGLTARARGFNPGMTAATGTVQWLGSTGGTRTENLGMPALRHDAASSPLGDALQWAELQANQPVLAHFSTGPSSQTRWAAVPMLVPASTFVLLGWRDSNLELEVRVANPQAVLANVTLRRSGSANTIFNRIVPGRLVQEEVLSNNQDAPSQVPLLYTVTADQPVVAGIRLNSGGNNEDDCFIAPGRPGVDLFLMGGRDSNNWDTRYLLFNPGTQLANYSLELVGTQSTYTINGGVLPPATGTVISTTQPGFPGSGDTELALAVQSTQPLYGQVLRFSGSSSLACLTALVP